MWPALIFLSISHTSDWLPHAPLTPLCPATLLVGCPYPYHQPHFWLEATLSFSSSYPYCSVPATLLTGPTLILPLSIYPIVVKHIQTWSVRTPSSYISL